MLGGCFHHKYTVEIILSFYANKATSPKPSSTRSRYLTVLTPLSVRPVFAFPRSRNFAESPNRTTAPSPPNSPSTREKILYYPPQMNSRPPGLWRRTGEVLRWRGFWVLLLLGARSILRPIAYWHVYRIFATDIASQVPEPYAKEKIETKITRAIAAASTKR